MNVRGPCSSCGAQLATDQRYCVEGGQRVGPPMALPYALPAPLTDIPGTSRWAFALPIPIQMAGTFPASTLPQVGDQVQSPVRKLANGTYTEQGARTQQGTADSATFLGTITYCADLELPSAPCNGSSPTDHYAYTVSSPGASVLVSAP